MRETGYYWVRYADSDWFIAKWVNESDFGKCWLICGWLGDPDDQDNIFEEIDETKITHL